MAVKPCPSCGSPSAPDARFCRVCGAPIKAFDSTDGQVSPQAETIPLTEEARSTDGLGVEERRQQATTTKISRVEVEKLLQQRRQVDEQAGDGVSDSTVPFPAASTETAAATDKDYAAPTTSALKAPPAVAALQSSKPPARGKSRVLLASLIGLACLALIAVSLVYYFSKRNRSVNTSETTTPAKNDERQQQSQTASAENAGGPAINPQPSLSPSPNVNATAQANKAEAERASHMQAERSRATESNTNVAPPQPSPTLAPVKPPPQPTPATLSASEHYRRGVELWNSNRQAAVTEFRAAAQSNPDAYYYLGLSIAEGRDPRSLMRAELVAALEYFQRAQAGPHRAEATKYVDRLGKEFDRRKAMK